MPLFNDVNDIHKIFGDDLYKDYLEWENNPDKQQSGDTIRVDINDANGNKVGETTVPVEEYMNSMKNGNRFMLGDDGAYKPISLDDADYYENLLQVRLDRDNNKVIVSGSQKARQSDVYKQLMNDINSVKDYGSLSNLTDESIAELNNDLVKSAKASADNAKFYRELAYYNFFAEQDGRPTMTPEEFSNLAVINKVLLETNPEKTTQLLTAYTIDGEKKTMTFSQWVEEWKGWKNKSGGFDPLDSLTVVDKQKWFERILQKAVEGDATAIATVNLLTNQRKEKDGVPYLESTLSGRKGLFKDIPNNLTPNLWSDNDKLVSVVSAPGMGAYRGLTSVQQSVAKALNLADAVGTSLYETNPLDFDWENFFADVNKKQNDYNTNGGGLGGRVDEDVYTAFQDYASASPVLNWVISTGVELPVTAIAGDAVMGGIARPFAQLGTYAPRLGLYAPGVVSASEKIGKYLGGGITRLDDAIYDDLVDAFTYRFNIGPIRGDFNMLRTVDRNVLKAASLLGADALLGTANSILNGKGFSYSPEELGDDFMHDLMFYGATTMTGKIFRGLKNAYYNRNTKTGKKFAEDIRNRRAQEGTSKAQESAYSKATEATSNEVSIAKVNEAYVNAKQFGDAVNEGTLVRVEDNGTPVYNKNGQEIKGREPINPDIARHIAKQDIPASSKTALNNYAYRNNAWLKEWDERNKKVLKALRTGDLRPLLPEYSRSYAEVGKTNRFDIPVSDNYIRGQRELYSPETRLAAYEKAWNTDRYDSDKIFNDDRLQKSYASLLSEGIVDPDTREPLKYNVEYLRDKKVSYLKDITLGDLSNAIPEMFVDTGKGIVINPELASYTPKTVDEFRLLASVLDTTGTRTDMAKTTRGYEGLTDLDGAAYRNAVAMAKPVQRGMVDTKTPFIVNSHTRFKNGFFNMFSNAFTKSGGIFGNGLYFSNDYARGQDLYGNNVFTGVVVPRGKGLFRWNDYTTPAELAEATGLPEGAFYLSYDRNSMTNLRYINHADGVDGDSLKNALTKKGYNGIYVYKTYNEDEGRPGEGLVYGYDEIILWDANDYVPVATQITTSQGSPIGYAQELDGDIYRWGPFYSIYPEDIEALKNKYPSANLGEVEKISHIEDVITIGDSNSESEIMIKPGEYIPAKNIFPEGTYVTGDGEAFLAPSKNGEYEYFSGESINVDALRGVNDKTEYSGIDYGKIDQAIIDMVEDNPRAVIAKIEKEDPENNYGFEYSMVISVHGNMTLRSEAYFNDFEEMFNSSVKKITDNEYFNPASQTVFTAPEGMKKDGVLKTERGIVYNEKLYPDKASAEQARKDDATAALRNLYRKYYPEYKDGDEKLQLDPSKPSDCIRVIDKYDIPRGTSDINREDMVLRPGESDSVFQAYYPIGDNLTKTGGLFGGEVSVIYTCDVKKAAYQHTDYVDSRYLDEIFGAYEKALADGKTKLANELILDTHYWLRGDWSTASFVTNTSLILTGELGLKPEGQDYASYTRNPDHVPSPTAASRQITAREEKYRNGIHYFRNGNREIYTVSSKDISKKLLEADQFTNTINLEVRYPAYSDGTNNNILRAAQGLETAKDVSEKPQLREDTPDSDDPRWQDESPFPLAKRGELGVERYEGGERVEESTEEPRTEQAEQTEQTTEQTRGQRTQELMDAVQDRLADLGNHNAADYRKEVEGVVEAATDYVNNIREEPMSLLIDNLNNKNAYLDGFDEWNEEAVMVELHWASYNVQQYCKDNGVTSGELYNDMDLLKRVAAVDPEIVDFYFGQGAYEGLTNIRSLYSAIASKGYEGKTIKNPDFPMYMPAVIFDGKIDYEDIIGQDLMGASFKYNTGQSVLDQEGNFAADRVERDLNDLTTGFINEMLAHRTEVEAATESIMSEASAFGEKINREEAGQRLGAEFALAKSNFDPKAYNDMLRGIQDGMSNKNFEAWSETIKNVRTSVNGSKSSAKSYSDLYGRKNRKPVISGFGNVIAKTTTGTAIAPTNEEAMKSISVDGVTMFDAYELYSRALSYSTQLTYQYSQNGMEPIYNFLNERLGKGAKYEIPKWEKALGNASPENVEHVMFDLTRKLGKKVYKRWVSTADWSTTNKATTKYVSTFLNNMTTGEFVKKSLIKKAVTAANGLKYQSKMLFNIRSAAQQLTEPVRIFESFGIGYTKDLAKSLTNKEFRQQANDLLFILDPKVESLDADTIKSLSDATGKLEESSNVVKTGKMIDSLKEQWNKIEFVGSLPFGIAERWNKRIFAAHILKAAEAKGLKYGTNEFFDFARKEYARIAIPAGELNRLSLTNSPYGSAFLMFKGFTIRQGKWIVGELKNPTKKRGSSYYDESGKKRYDYDYSYKSGDSKFDAAWDRVNFIARMFGGTFTLWMIMSLLGYSVTDVFTINPFDDDQYKGVDEEDKTPLDRTVDILGQGPVLGDLEDIYYMFRSAFEANRDETEAPGGFAMPDSVDVKSTILNWWPGGAAIKRFTQFTDMMENGYSIGASGNRQYEAPTDPFNIAKGAIFGKSATDNAMEYWGNPSPIASLLRYGPEGFGQAVKQGGQNFLESNLPFYSSNDYWFNGSYNDKQVWTSTFYNYFQKEKDEIINKYNVYDKSLSTEDKFIRREEELDKLFEEFEAFVKEYMDKHPEGLTDRQMDNINSLFYINDNNLNSEIQNEYDPNYQVIEQQKNLRNRYDLPADNRFLGPTEDNPDQAYGYDTSVNFNDYYYGATNDAERVIARLLDKDTKKEIKEKYNELKEAVDPLYDSGDYDRIKELQNQYLQTVVDPIVATLVSIYGVGIFGNEDVMNELESALHLNKTTIPSDDYQKDKKGYYRSMPDMTVDVKKWAQKRYANIKSSNPQDMSAQDQIQAIRDALNNGQTGKAKALANILYDNVTMYKNQLSREELQWLLKVMGREK